MAAGIMDIVLERDGHDQPWGFRLQGGVDVAMPLSVQRVLVGTPADGTLHKGDVITKISCTETRSITHQQAADLFNNAGNQITVHIKRAGAKNTPAAPVASNAPLVNGSTVQGPIPVPVSGGVPFPGITSSTTARSENPAVRLLPKTQFVLKSELLRQQKQPPVNMETLSIQSQPYRTLPLLQPSAKALKDLGVGSISHLKMQDDHITGVKEPQYVPQSQVVTAKAKHDELVMKQKVTGTLQHIQQTQTSLSSGTQQLPPAPGGPVNKQYNSPQALYSQENVHEVINMQASGGTPGHTINPASNPSNKPISVILTPSKEYNPQSSATWRALQETDASVDPEKIASYSSLKEHDPIYSEVYTAPTAPKPGQRPVPRTNALPGPRSHVSELLPPNLRPAGEQSQVQADQALGSLLSPFKPGGPSQVLSAALADSQPINHQVINDKIPLYETNSIGGRRKIAQTASFNKLMMDVLGE